MCKYLLGLCSLPESKQPFPKVLLRHLVENKDLGIPGPETYCHMDSKPKYNNNTFQS